MRYLHRGRWGARGGVLGLSCLTTLPTRGRRGAVEISLPNHMQTQLSMLASGEQTKQNLSKAAVPACWRVAMCGRKCVQRDTSSGPQKPVCLPSVLPLKIYTPLSTAPAQQPRSSDPERSKQSCPCPARWRRAALPAAASQQCSPVLPSQPPPPALRQAVSLQGCSEMSAEAGGECPVIGRLAARTKGSGLALSLLT